ncbi:hypothetical protein FWF74_03175 [Candidatus Saccharibacteria bacterium]|nr:hypothetical protein [Candidatus Saccharibacteria bacterium]MCL1962822.1 hypothetical protein [Candidatus Saccharibacteria bacterium]
MEQNLHKFNDYQPYPHIKISDEAQAAVDHFQSRIKVGHDRERIAAENHDTEQTMMLFRDFCGGDFPDNSPVYDAIALVDIHKGLQERLRERIAHRALNGYIKPDERTEYVFGLLDDCGKVDDFWQKQSSISIEDMCNLLGTVDLEAIPILGAKSLAFMCNRMPLRGNDIQEVSNSPEMQNQMALAQTLLAPACELIGYDGLAMALQSVVSQAAMRRDRQTYFIDKAREVLDQLPPPEELQEDITRVIGGLLDHDSINAESFQGGERHGILFGEGLWDRGNDLPDGRFVYRRKSTGSIATKVQDDYRKYGRIETPRDIVGITIIAQDDKERLRIFGQMITNAGRVDDQKIGSAKIIGSSDFIEQMISGISGTYDENAAKLEAPVERNNGYQTAKVYIRRKNTPFEIQVTTRQERDMNRYGRTAHILYKKPKRGDSAESGDQIDEKILEFMADIHDRREHIGEAELRPTTINASRILIRQLSRVGHY